VRKILLGLALCLVALSSVECGGSGGRQSLVKLAPASSFAVLSLNWETVSRDSDLKRITKGSEIERMFEQLDIVSSSVTELAIFSDAGKSYDASNGIILRGSFKNDEVVAGLKRRGWLEQSYHGRKIYTNPVDRIYLISLKRNVLALGTRTGVEQTVEAEENSEASFASNGIYRKLSKHVGDKRFPVAMVIAIPQTTQDMAATALQVSSVVLDMAGVGPLGELLNKIGYARGVGCVISRKNDAFPMEMTVIMKDESAATLVSGGLNLMKSLSAMAPKNNLSQTDQEALQSLQSLFISREHEVISIKMTIARNDLLPGTK
jgi:hypothetical protein